jgi:hypothetical protein
MLGIMACGMLILGRVHRSASFGPKSTALIRSYETVSGNKARATPNPQKGEGPVCPRSFCDFGEWAPSTHRFH